MSRVREAIRRLVLGDAPRLSRPARLLLVSVVVAGGYVCYHFRLVHARTFGAIGVVFILLILLARRYWWWRQRRAA